MDRFKAIPGYNKELKKWTVIVDKYGEKETVGNIVSRLGQTPVFRCLEFDTSDMAIGYIRNNPILELGLEG